MELTPGRVSEIRRSVLPVVRFATPTDLPLEIDLGDVGGGVSAKVVLEQAAESPPPAESTRAAEPPPDPETPPTPEDTTEEETE